MNKLYNKSNVTEMINSGKKLILAGDERVLQELPSGSWIAGTIPYFMDTDGGVFSQDKIFVTELPQYIKNASIIEYDENNLMSIYKDMPKNGFGIIIIPASSKTHLSFALNTTSFPHFGTKPLIGWISGVFLDELGKRSPKVFNGTTSEAFDNKAVVLNVELPENQIADIQIINIFNQGKGDTIVFHEDGFSAKEAIINGEKMNFADYITNNNIDTKLPLVTGMYGTMLNTSFQNIDIENKQVNFYAPVFKNAEYKIADQVDNYIEAFTGMIPKDISDNIFFSCNCILNYLYAELEGKKTESFTGPITFGEVAYQLLNQTLAYLTIDDF